MNPILLYTIVVFFACLFAKNAGGGKQKKFKNIWLIISFLTLCLFIVFTDTGTDYYNYLNIITNRHDFSDIEDFRNIEPLFTVWAHFGWLLFGNGHIVIATIKIATLINTFLAIYLLRKELQPFYGVMTYAVISYLPGFALIRIIFGASFVTLGVALLLKNKKPIWTLLLCFVGIGFHFSCIMPTLAIAVYLVLEKLTLGRQARNIILTLLIIGIIIGVTQASSLISSFIATSESFEHYEKYVDKMHSASLGMLAVLAATYSLFFYVLVNASNKIESGSKYFFLFIMILFGVTFEFVGTLVPVMERDIYNFIFVYCLVFPYCLQRFKWHNPNKSLIDFIVVLFFIVRFYYVLKSRAFPDSPTGLYYYHFFNPFTSM